MNSWSNQPSLGSSSAASRSSEKLVTRCAAPCSSEPLSPRVRVRTGSTTVGNPHVEAVTLEFVPGHDGGRRHHQARRQGGAHEHRLVGRAPPGFRRGHADGHAPWKAIVLDDESVKCQLRVGYDDPHRSAPPSL